MFSFRLGEWTDSSNDKKVMELERSTEKLKLSVSHAWDHWDFVSEDQED